mgnify:FL=1
MYQVFLVDDEPWAIMVLKNMIDWNEYGFVVSGEAEDGTQALERIERTKPDLILADIRMPGMDGLELIKELREREIKSQVLLVSGYSDFEYARTAIRFGCAGYLVKPVEEAELIENISRIKKMLDEENPEKKTEKEQQEEGYLSEKQQIKKMLDFIHEHYAESLSLQVMAETFGLRETYLSSLIKKQTGKGFSEHLTDVRIQKAMELLQTTNDSIESVAQQVGYTDYYYFSKVYKKVTGMTPAAYRKQF